MLTSYVPPELAPRFRPFATEVAPNIFAPLHDHTAAWLVDLDVGGTQNAIHVTSIKGGTYAKALSSVNPSLVTPGWVEPEFDDVRFVKTDVYNTETSFRADPAAPKMFKLVSAQQRNALGHPRGYAIVLDNSPSQLLRSTPVVTQGLNWTRHSVAFTKRRDNESYLSDARLDAWQLTNPVVNFNNILNGEALDSEAGEDLVAWVTLSFIHVPKSEDVPVISNVQSSFVIKPVNFFDHLASLDLPDESEDEFRLTCLPRVGRDYWYFYVSDEPGRIEIEPRYTDESDE